ncbi:hypothetical protein [Bacillus sp. Marseille-P3661]|uniref:hypothetical protein n=1 Tax=Bacillus sp. Marseille-P3661 TaxID=1936234 RepID=UPI000C82F42C|nr:hypothetical protein [Bacillus sp. Marseille-P3661]
MSKKISELYEHELIEMVASNKYQDQIKKEWFSRWGLEFPLIRTASGVKKYGESFTITNKEHVAL